MREVRIVNHTSAKVDVSVNDGAIVVVVGGPDSEGGGAPIQFGGGPVIGRFGVKPKKVER